MLTSSLDILWIVLAIVVLWVGLFVGLGAFYLAMVVRDISVITKNMKKKMDLIDQILQVVKKRVDKTANYLPPLIEGVGKIIEHIKDKKTKGKASKK